MLAFFNVCLVLCITKGSENFYNKKVKKKIKKLFTCQLSFLCSFDYRTFFSFNTYVYECLVQNLLHLHVLECMLNLCDLPTVIQN